MALCLVLAPVGQAMAQTIGAQAAGAVTLPIVGTVVNSTGASVGVFSGSITVNSFTRLPITNVLMAVGVVRGIVTNTAGQVLGSGLQSIALPAVLSSLTAVNYTPPPSGGPRLMRASLTTGGSARFTPVQFGACGGGLHVAMGGGAAVNIMGYNVSVNPVVLDVSATTGPVGGLVCQILGLLGGVMDPTSLLNSLLGTVTGLLGGATGGLLGGIL
ncbi:MAG TPA: hypothetical protein VE422_36545 [Terriglobia bacterium]|nr:hypothetical protein [Terriglobia bacterium]